VALIKIWVILQRFAFRLTVLILQYIPHSKTEEKIAPRFLLQENHTLKSLGFFCQPQNTTDFGRKSKKNTKWRNQKRTIETQTAV